MLIAHIGLQIHIIVSETLNNIHMTHTQYYKAMLLRISGQYNDFASILTIFLYFCHWFDEFQALKTKHLQMLSR